MRGRSRDGVGTATWLLAPGAPVECTDGPRGVLTRVVLDPRTLRVTHLVVGLRHARSVDHLVPLGWVAEAAADSIRLDYPRADVTFEEPFTAFRDVEIPSEDPFGEPGPCVSDAEGLTVWANDRMGRYGSVDHVILREASPLAGEVSWGKRTRAHDATGAYVGSIARVDVARETGEVVGICVRRGHLRRREIPFDASDVLEAADDGLVLASRAPRPAGSEGKGDTMSRRSPSPGEVSSS